jgi:hypothetical protein
VTRSNQKIIAPSTLVLNVVVSISCILALAFWFSQPTWAAPPVPLPPRPGPDLPPRPNPDQPPSTGKATGTSSDHSEAPPGAYISLHAGIPTAGLWTVVQWQDDLSNWHDIEGWRGTFEGSHKTWWVDAKDFSKGPFRWVVYQGQNGIILTFSDAFYLPQFPFETVLIDVEFKP